MAGDLLIAGCGLGLVIFFAVIILILIAYANGSSPWLNSCGENSDCPTGYVCTSENICRKMISLSCDDGGLCLLSDSPDQNSSIQKKTNIKRVRLNIKEQKSDKTYAKINTKELVIVHVPPKIEIVSKDPVIVPTNYTINFDQKYMIRSPDSSNMTSDITDITGDSTPLDIRSNGSFGTESCSTNTCDELTPIMGSTRYITNKLYSRTPFINGENGSYCPLENNGIVDIVTFSNNTIYLQKDGSIRRGDKRIKVSIRGSKKDKLIESITVFNGDLFGLVDGKLYYLLTITLYSRHWRFQKVDSNLIPLVASCLSKRIIRISTTLPGDRLILQLENELVIMSKNGTPTIIEEFPSNIKRIFGNTLNEFVDIDRMKMTANFTSPKVVSALHGTKSEGYRINNVIDALVDHTGKLVTLTLDKSRNLVLTGIRLVNYKVYYISSH